MLHNEICPNCRSVYEVVGKLDFNANAISVCKCPVCTQEKWIPSGFPFPQSWTITGKVITRQPVTNPPVRLEAPKNNKPVYVDFSLLGEATSVGDKITGTIKNIGTWAVIMGVLVVLVVYQDEVKEVVKSAVKK